MTNGLLYWILVWGVMASAFGLAWLFIVKGCERLDASHSDAHERDVPRQDDQRQDPQASPSASDPANPPN